MRKNFFSRMFNNGKENAEERKRLERRAMINLQKEMEKDESEMTLEEKKQHTEKIKALNDVLKEARGEDKTKTKQTAIQFGLKAGTVILGIAIEAFLLNNGTLTKMKEKLIDNIIRIS